jgi:hypothetical protein
MGENVRRSQHVAMRMRTVISGLVSCGAGIMSCYPGQVVSVPQLASVTTVVDSQAPLKAARTFTLLDTIALAKRTDGGLTVSHLDALTIVGRIRTELLARGWVEIKTLNGARPDVVVLTAVFVKENTGVAYADWWNDYGYWGGWPAGYGAGMQWGVPGAEITFTYDSGTLAIAMLDLRHGDLSAKRVPLLWAAAINGVVTTGVADAAAAGVSQAFRQSPYLERP